MAPANESGDKPRDGYGKFADDPDAKRRDAQAMRMRAKGATYEEIAVALGYHDRSHVRNAVKRHLAAIVPPAAEELRQVMDEQLDDLYRKAVAVLEAQHFTVSHGQIVYHPDDNEFGEGPRKPLEDDGPVLAAIDRILKIQQRRAALWGLDAPSQQRIQVQNVRVTVDGADDV